MQFDILNFYCLQYISYRKNTQASYMKFLMLAIQLANYISVKLIKPVSDRLFH